MWDRAWGRPVGSWPSLSFLPSPLLLCPLLSQGPSGLPGSTGQKVMGLDLAGRVPRRSLGPSDLRKQKSEVSLGDGEHSPHRRLCVPPSHTAGPSSHRPRGKCHRLAESGRAGLAWRVLLLSTFVERQKPFSQGRQKVGSRRQSGQSCFGSSSTFFQPQSRYLFLPQGQKGEKGDGGIKGSPGKPGRDVRCWGPFLATAPWPLVQSWNWPAVSNLLALLRQNRNPGKDRQGPRKQSKEGMEKDPSPGSLAPSLSP